MLTADIPNLEVDVGQVNCRDILANGGDGIELRVKVRAEEGFDLFEQGCLSSVVESKKENGILLGSRQPKSNCDGVFASLVYLLCLSHADRATSPSGTCLL